MRFTLLDANIVNALVKQNARCWSRAQAASGLSVSSLTLAEIRYGLSKRKDRPRFALAVTELLRPMAVLPWDSACAEVYGHLRAGLEAKGVTLSPIDLMLAAHAVALDAMLISNDRIFRSVPGLKTANWLE